MSNGHKLTKMDNSIKLNSELYLCNFSILIIPIILISYK